MNDEVFLGDPRDLIDEDCLLGRAPLPVDVTVERVDRVGSQVEVTFEWVASSVRQTVVLDEGEAVHLACWIADALDDRTTPFTDEPDPLVFEEHEVGAA